MNTAQILSILTRYVPHCYKVGVYPKDKIPSTLPKRSCIVINTDPSDRPGEHWLALFVLDHLEFFDSYAFPPSFYGLKFASAIPALTLRNHFKAILVASTAFCFLYAALMVSRSLASAQAIATI